MAPEDEDVPPQGDLRLSSSRYPIARYLSAYDWLSDSEFVGYGPLASIDKMVRYDIRTNQETILSSIDCLMRDCSKEGTMLFPDLTLSPDRRRLVWCDNALYASERLYHSALLDGSGLCTWDVGSHVGVVWIVSSPRWLADGSGCVTMTRPVRRGGVSAVLAKLSDPGELKTVPLDVPEAIFGWQEGNRAFLLGGTGGNRILGVGLGRQWDEGDTDKSFPLFELDMAVGESSLRWWEVSVKGASHVRGWVNGLAYSPQSNRIAWITSTYGILAPPERTWLCTSRLDGGDLRVLGRVEKQLHAPWLRWLPSGKAVSFIGYDGDTRYLWITPDEQGDPDVNDVDGD